MFVCIFVRGFSKLNWMYLVETSFFWCKCRFTVLRQIHAAEGNPFLQPLLLIDLLVPWQVRRQVWCHMHRIIADYFKIVVNLVQIFTKRSFGSSARVDSHRSGVDINVNVTPTRYSLVEESLYFMEIVEKYDASSRSLLMKKCGDFFHLWGSKSIADRYWSRSWANFWTVWVVSVMNIWWWNILNTRRAAWLWRQKELTT